MTAPQRQLKYMPTVSEIGSGSCCTPFSLRIGSEEALSISEELSLLAHPVRLQLLDILSQHEGEVCVCDLEASLPVKQPTVSHHLRILKEAGLIDFDRRGLWSYYYLKKQRLADVSKRLAMILDRF